MTLVRNWEGKVIGSYKEHIYRGNIRRFLSKRVEKSKHLFRRNPGWAFDQEILEKASEDNIEFIEVVEVEEMRRYITDLDNYLIFGEQINLGSGLQVVLPLDYFEVWEIKNG